MKNRTILWIMILASTALGGIIFIQSSWLRNAIEIQEQQFERISRDVLKEAFQNRSRSDIKNKLAFLQTQGDKEIVTRYIRNIIDSSLKQNGLTDKYEFLISSCSCNDKVLFSTNNAVNKDITASKIKTSIGTHSEDEHPYFISLYFPSKAQFVMQRLGWQLLISFILLAVFVGAFIYTIQAWRKQKKLSAIKNDFVNNMTHELKTPIASIRLASRMLQKAGHITGKEYSYIRLIDNESRRLESQVDKVLQIAVIESGNFQLERSNINIHDIIKKVAAVFELIVHKEDGTIELNLLSANPFIYADELHVTNILYNLLDNAVKYTKNAPRIIISTEDKEGNLCISIKDNGIGISTEAQQYIFDKFYRVQSGNVQTVKGFGLGLSYVKHIVDAHKGNISITSEINNGSEFKLLFPL